MGQLHNRREILAALASLPKAAVASDAEVLQAIDHHRLFGVGLGYIDAHILTATLISPRATLWTRDRRLRTAAERLGVVFDPAG